MRRAPSFTRSVLSEQVKDHLLEEILAGRYPPGERLVERRLARELGLSQAPVREALRGLEALGVVEITAYRGARVRRPSKAELHEAYAIRAELESLGARLALPRLTDADLRELQASVDAMQAAAREGDPHEEARVDAAFHSRVISIAKNGTLNRVWRSLEPVSRTYITLGLPGIDPRQIADLHQPILNALRIGDADRAADAVRRHFQIAGSLFDVLFSDDGTLTNGASGKKDEELPRAIAM